MATDHTRRPAAALNPPPAPPLPPPQRTAARNAFSRLAQSLAGPYASRPNIQQSRGDSASNPLTPRIPGLSSLSSQDASHKTGLDISAVHINQARTHAILAGREILKTISIDGTQCAEEINLRTAVINYAAHNTTGSTAPIRHRDTLEIHDVKWSHGSYSSHIATAAANGKLVLYDLNRTGVELVHLHEHNRQVHKLAFNPFQGHSLLSASRDAFVRLWDLRDMRKEGLCASRDKYAGQSEGIRDVQWSPTDGVEFAFGTENGVIQRWDIRMNRAPKLKINAHDKTCFSIDWHPDGKYLASAGADKSVRIWDFSSEARRQKPAWLIRTPYPVSNARWRPPFWSAGAHDNDNGIWQCTQLATAYDKDHPVVHLWDFRRPSLPFREILPERCSTAPTDLLWRSRDLLWTVGREGIFSQSDVHFSPKVVDRRNMSGFAVSTNGEVGAFTQRRLRRRASYSSDETYTTDGRAKRDDSEKNSLPRSSADDSIDDSFLSSSFKRHHGRSASNRSTKSVASNPPSEPGPKEVMLLCDSLASKKYSFTPNQVAFRGVLPGTFNVSLFTFLAHKYKAISVDDPPSLQSFEELRKVFYANADYAQKAGYYRLADSWRIVGLTVYNAVWRRAEANKNLRLKHQNTSSAKIGLPEGSIVMAAKREHEQPTNPAIRAIYGADLHIHATPDSSSNVATPVARPINQDRIPAQCSSVPLLDLDHEDNLTLPPSAIDVQALTSNQASDELESHSSGLNDSQSAHSTDDLEERRATLSSWRAPPRVPLNLEPYDNPALNGRPPFVRHDSGESFAMFSASTDSRGDARGLSVPGSFASGWSQSFSSESLPERWEQEHPPRVNFGDSLPQRAAINDHSNRRAETSPGAILAAAPFQASALASSAEQSSKVLHDMEMLRQHNQLMRNSSTDSDAFPSSKGSFSEASLSNFDAMEASGTIVPDASPGVSSPQRPLPTSIQRQSIGAPSVMEPDATKDCLVLSDFLTKHEDVDSEQETPLSLIDLLHGLVEFHASVLCDAQTIAHVLLLTMDLLPQNQTTPEVVKTAILHTYADQLSSMSMSPAMIRTILNNHLVPLMRTGINPLQAESILATYHNQLLSLNLFNAAAFLRRLSYPTHPAVYEQALQETQIALRCTQCKNAINNTYDKLLCENCKRRQAPCPICWGVYPPFEAPSKKRKSRAGKLPRHSGSLPSRSRASCRAYPSHKPSDVPTASDQLGSGSFGDEFKSMSRSAPEKQPAQPTLYTSCALCGHVAHMACLRVWFSEPLLSEGACPVEGCLCDCVRGPRREAKLEELRTRKAVTERGKVRDDGRKVVESRAVYGARGRLVGGTDGVAGVGEVFGDGNGRDLSRQGSRDDLAALAGGGGRRVRVVEPAAGKST
ncbi:hypothetical protein K490DRAFT_35391 [Saccharata proteae CBS 121410]|uniref:WDR59/RTC1-like RING zinc finger domain-containing protein n=1 Tax=Saccharata proteae CBS 121410 TaxID=1314787 RepID=A0A9P4HYS9_9PEZI|nr:hypothetical protein K490DRAFT_35391 [Saccharata proteae CBS 121410]